MTVVRSGRFLVTDETGEIVRGGSAAGDRIRAHGTFRRALAASGKVKTFDFETTEQVATAPPPPPGQGSLF